MRTQVVLLAAGAMLAFAANSVLARLALGAADAGAAVYTGARLLSGAATLAIIVGLRMKVSTVARMNDSWPGALTLLGFALAFSVAYVVLGAATGALILFGSVQFSMLGWAIFKGERPNAIEWLGVGVASAALIFLLGPSLQAPHPMDAMLMMIAGACWAAYSVIGRGSRAPLADNASNFIRCAPVAILLMVAGLLSEPLTAAGLAYAVMSGAIASGVGYAVWYSVLPSLSRTSSAFIQLTVPVLAAAGGVLLIGEQMTGHLLLASAGVIGGIARTLWGSKWGQGSANARS
ncbi:MAG TPA: EamA family transporter [Pseudorhizobium sp.]|nr:EamA family transporter [Pseudorhizobium sp.]